MLTRAARELDYNSETGSEALSAAREVRFCVRGLQFAFNVKMPIYQKEKLKSADWERSIAATQRYAEELVLASATAGYIGGVAPGCAEKLQKYLSEQLYERFLDYQETAGNRTWEVPESQLTPLDRDILA